MYQHGRLVALFVLLSLGTQHCRGTGASEGGSELQYYGTDNRRAAMTFDGSLIYKYPVGWTDSADKLLTSQFREEIDEQIEWQLRHMFSAFTTHPDFVKKPGVVAGTHTVQILGIAKIPNQPAARIQYRFTEPDAVFHKDTFKNGNRQIKFVLPAEVTGIYAKGFKPNGRKNWCTDSHYQSEDDFWYFWNPFQTDCPIKSSDLVTITATLQPKNSTTSTYPDYNRLYASNGNRRTLKVTALVGVDKNFSNGDAGKAAYKELLTLLRGGGYQVREIDTRSAKVGMSQQTEFDLDMTVTLVDPNETEFDALAVDGLTTADIFIYNGHSGLGGHLAPGKLEDFIGKRLTMPRDKYQVLIFQGCSTFAYYNKEYFKLKQSRTDPKGTINLDIVTTSIGLYFHLGAKQDYLMIDALLRGNRPTWQRIIDDVYAVDPAASALTQINGDEDNPRAPR